MSTRIKIVTTVDAVVNSISEAIYKLEYLPGQQLTELELTEEYGVSRNTMREAVAKLSVSGLLVKEAHRGIFVKELTSDDVRDIYQTRTALEVDSIQRICQAGVVPKNLYELMDKIESTQWQDNWYESVDADVAFHAGLVKAANSPRLSHFYEILCPEIKLCQYQSKLTLLPDPVNKYKHRDLVAALEKGEEDVACDLIRRHIAFGRDNIVKGFSQKRGD